MQRLCLVPITAISLGVTSYVNSHDIHISADGLVTLKTRCKCCSTSEHSGRGLLSTNAATTRLLGPRDPSAAISGPCAHPPSLGQRGVAVSVVRRLQTNLLVQRSLPCLISLRLQLHLFASAPRPQAPAHHPSPATSSCWLGK